MAIRFDDLLNLLPKDTYDRVERTRKRVNNTVREAIRRETGLMLNRQDSNDPNGDQADISIPITIVPGVPNKLRELRFDDSYAMVLRLSPFRNNLEETKRGLTGLMPLLRSLEGDGAEMQSVAGPRQAAELTLNQVVKLLRLLDREDPVRLVLSVDEDVLGAYIYKLPSRNAPDTDPLSGKIELYWGVIGLIAGMLGVSVEGLTAVVLIHELAHGYTHLGADIDGRRWASKCFCESEHALKEGLAQFYTHYLTNRIENQVPTAHASYQELLKHQPAAYKSHERWVKKSTPEEIRLAMLRVRRQGAATISHFQGELWAAHRQLGSDESEQKTLFQK